MKKALLALLMMCVVLPTLAAKKMVSPNGKLKLEMTQGHCLLSFNKKPVMELSQLGIKDRRLNEDAFLQMVRHQRVKTDYQMISGKRQHCTNEANEYWVPLGNQTTLVFRLYNDGLAFRYELTGLQNEQQPRELTTYHIAEGTKRWMLQWSDGYEGFYPLTTTAKVKPVPSYGAQSKSPDGFNNRWGYPALLEPVDGIFALLTEANIERRQSASSLFNDGEHFHVVADQNDVKMNGDWHTPWRLIITGTLADVVQSTLVTDVSEPCRLNDTRWIQPGVVSWVYWAYNHGSNDLNIIKKYVDLAVALHLPYVLIDAEWDEMKDGKRIDDALAYAKEKGIKPVIWYNSSVGWVNGAPGPKFRLNKAEDREREFAWCERMGVAGVKIDFFSGDNQMNMDYCLDLLESAAKHHLLVNFHGATVPRGWQRTYPNLLSTEGVYGAEWYNNVPTFTDKAAAHNATLPFTRNVIGPMDYTPCAFSNSQHPHITSNAHELALTVLFESGLQHLADRPESFLAQPAEVQKFLSALPAAWEETRLLAGYPGEDVIIARRSGTTWYIAGINGSDQQKTLKLKADLLKTLTHALPKAAAKGGIKKIEMFADTASQPWQITTLDNMLPTEVICQPRGGFIIVIRS